MGKSSPSSYSIGLDIGVKGVGWDVIGADGLHIKLKGRPAWGVRLFDEGNHAADRRVKRSGRRRYVRRRHRLNMLQELLGSDMQEVDPLFFRKMKESALWDEDRQIPNGLEVLLRDIVVDGEPYHKKFPTIYHLREYLMETDKKVDFRLVYLALHHTMKYRGNFLYEGQPLSAKGNLEEEIREAINTYLRFIDPNSEKGCTEGVIRSITAAVADTALGRMDTRNTIRDLLVKEGCDRTLATEFGKALAGSKIDAVKLFMLEGVEKIEIALSSENLEDDIALVPNEEAQIILELLGRAYSASVLDEILGGCDSISKSMIKRYSEHAKQLRSFKQLVRDYAPERYSEMFRKEGGGLKNYSNYIIGENSTRKDFERKAYACSRDDFLAAAKKLLESMPEDVHVDARHQELLQAINSGTFLSKLRTRKNGAIPYQLHSQEMSRIIELQSAHYPTLKAGYAGGTHRLIQILEFRIPYFVGPLSYNPNASESDRFDWLTRRIQGEKITPWNFDEVINREQTAEDFITRMTGTCTYLLGEDVLPKHSVLYQDFELLNELNKISIDGKPIAIDVKKKAFDELFMRQKRVSHKAFADWLIRENHHPRDTAVKIAGTQKESEFACSRSTLIDMQKIFNGKAEENIGRCEDIILWSTLFNEESMVEAKIRREYPEVTDVQFKAIKKLRYKGWGRLSQKLLSGLKVQDRSDAKVSIISLMRDTRMNFMEIVNAKEYDFAKLIEQNNEESLVANLNFSPKLLDDIVASSAVKRGIWQALLIVKELTQVMGAPPENIFIEMARGDEAKHRTVSRYARLKNLLKALDEDLEYSAILKEFNAKSKNQKAFDNRSLYLYFMQLGKCLYCGKGLDVERLNIYQVDHIIPRSLTKDDSFENLALVHQECNQTKGDSLTINADVRHKMGAFWRMLEGKRLMGSKKYCNLTRCEFKERDIERFVARQLVETRQINRRVVEILHVLYPESEIHGIKAGVVSDLRKRLALPKIRELNDTHHAMDAHLTALMGLFIQKCYPGWRSESSYGEYMKFARTERKSRFGMFVSQFPKTHADTTTGEILWDGEVLERTLRNLMEEKRYFITKRSSAKSGAFYDETVYASPQNDATARKLIPKGKGLETSKYGGYSGERESYSVLIEYQRTTKNRSMRLVSIPVRIAMLGKSAVGDFLQQNYSDCRIVRDNIKAGHQIYCNGNPLYISSANEAHNARQIFLSYEEQKQLREVLNEENPAGELDKEALELCKAIAGIIEGCYPIYKNIGTRILSDLETFENLEPEEKQEFLLELLRVTAASPGNGNFSKYKVGGLKGRVGRLSRFTFGGFQDMEFLDLSITGIYEGRFRV